MKNLILIIEDEIREFNTIIDLKEYFVPNWQSLSQEEIEKKLYEKAFAISRIEKLQIVQTQKGVYGDNYQITEEKIDREHAIIIDSIETYLMSLCKINLIMLLEEKENRIFTSNLFVEKLEEGNYIIINAYAEIILKMMVGDSYDA